MRSDFRPLSDLDLIVPRWEVPPHVHARMTTRVGGLSDGPWGSGQSSAGGMNLGLGSGDDRATVLANRARLRDVLPGEPAWLRQVHGVRAVDADVVVADAEPFEADASFTAARRRVCAILVADCAPVLLTDGVRVAAAHAGWRGLAGGVLEATIATSGLDVDRTIAWIGPCIGPSRFEVGPEVREAFVRADRAADEAFATGGSGKYLANLPMLAAARLRRAGIGAVHREDRCTVLEGDVFYSYRRDGVTGRMAALVWMS